MYRGGGYLRDFNTFNYIPTDFPRKQAENRVQLLSLTSLTSLAFLTTEKSVFLQQN